MNAPALLKIAGLKVAFHGDRCITHAVDTESFEN